MDPNESLFKIFVPMLKAAQSDDGRMRLRGVASSTVKDRHGDTITLGALHEMEASARNLTIFLNHKYDIPEDVAGSVEHAEIRRSADDVHDLLFDIVINDENPRAEKAWRAIQKGTQLGLSIGARIPPGGATRDKETGRYTIEHIDLLETSLVSVPANPRSWVEYAVKSLHEVAETEEISFTDENSIDVTKAPLSSESRNNLPDSAFACPGKRKYPHHTASGAVDKAHLRNALSRCGDTSNDQCGCAHIRAHAKSLGIGSDAKSFEDLLVFA
ncbi:MAG TPA: HK97 family phage prohead protease, partial [Candidatus Deferrimicrobiaceae bacterium]